MLDSVALRDIQCGDEIFVSYKMGDHSETLEVRPRAVSATLVFVGTFKSVSASSGGMLTRAFVNMGCAAVSQRREYLQKWYGFKCACRHCSAYLSRYNIPM